MGAVGALASAIGAYYFIAVASGDETFKRNTSTTLLLSFFPRIIRSFFISRLTIADSL